jgi:hypothetical protein
MGSTPFNANQLYVMPSPAVSLGQVQSLRDMMLQNQIGQEQLKQQQFANQQAQLQAQKDAQAAANYQASVAALYGSQPQGGPPVAPPVPDGTTAPGQRPTIVGGTPQGNLMQSDPSVPAAAGGVDDPADSQASPETTPGAQPVAPAAQPSPVTPSPASIPVGRRGTPLVTPGVGGPTPADLMALAADAHAKAGNLTQAREFWKQSADMREKQAEADKFASEAQKNAVETAQKQHSYIAQGLQAVRDAPPELKQETYDRVIAGAVSKGYAAPSDFEPNVPNDAALKAFEQRLTEAGDQLAQRKQAMEEQKNSSEQKRLDDLHASQVAEANSKALSAQLAAVAPALAQANNAGQWDVLLAGIDPKVRAQFGEFSLANREKARQLGLTAEQQVTTGQTAKRDAQVASNEAVRNEIARGELGVSAGRLNIEKQRFGYDTGTGVSPAAEAIATGKMDPQGVRIMMRSNPGIIGQVLKIDPSFDEANMDKRYQVLREFSDSNATKAGGQVLALNTMLHHADLFQQVGAALNNTTFKPGNAVYNRVISELGFAPPQDAKLVAQFLAGEVAKLSKGGVATDGEIKQIMKELGDNGSPEQIEHAGDRLIQIAAGRAIPLQEKVQDARLGNVVKVIGPAAREILQRSGYDPETLKKRNAPAQTANPFAPSSSAPVNPFR